MKGRVLKLIQRWDRPIRVAISILFVYALIDSSIRAHYAYTEMAISFGGRRFQIAVVDGYVHLRRREMALHENLGLTWTSQWAPAAAFKQQHLPVGVPEFKFPQWFASLLLVLCSIRSFSMPLSKRLDSLKRDVLIYEENESRRTIARINGRIVEVAGLVGTVLSVVCVTSMPRLPIHLGVLTVMAPLFTWWLGRIVRRSGEQRNVQPLRDSTESLAP